MWFKKLTGFNELSIDFIKENLVVKDDKIFSIVNNKFYQFGSLEVSTLESLKKQSNFVQVKDSKIKVSEVVDDVQRLHIDKENKNALFQAASQFNLLEMIGPHITPEMGIDRYENDYTQGPACAIACGAGTIYRNYFAPVKDGIGQTEERQIDCLDLIALELNNSELELWKMKNGYAMVNQEGLLTINKKINNLNESERELLKEKLKIGIQWNTEVTIADSSQLVSQVYCSALPVSYSTLDSFYWESFARLILEATYEATFHSALLNIKKHNSNKLFLTLVGGGAFGNDIDWIYESLERTIIKFENTPLDVKIVSYGASNSLIKKLER